MAAEHAELVFEMAELEKMNHTERVKQAKKRRAQQLKYYQKCDQKAADDEKVACIVLYRCICFYLVVSLCVCFFVLYVVHVRACLYYCAHVCVSFSMRV